jgi:hypothetical protein
MPLQNRVAPDGTIFADPARGLMMGNRGGQMHDGERRLTGRRWVSRAWIACTLQYKDRREVIMAPGHYTQLFFLDEATALAAGHRPCALCRRTDFVRFITLWQQARGLDARLRAAEVDRVLHDERIAAPRAKRTFPARLGDLPPGVMADAGAGPVLLWTGRHWRWTPSGYLPADPIDDTAIVNVLTPQSIVTLLAAGYAPLVHDSACSISAARSS